MGARNGWIVLSVMLAVAFVVALLLPRGTTVVVINKTVEWPVDMSLVRRIDMPSFDKDEKKRLEEVMPHKFTKKCELAFHNANLMSPSDIIIKAGLVIRPARDLWLKDSDTLGFVYPNTRGDYQSEFSSGRAQAGTVPFMREGRTLTVDGRARIFIHDSAFFGESFWARRLSLSDVLTHELIHVGGQPKTPGWFGFLQDDLAGFEQYEAILEACR